MGDIRTRFTIEGEQEYKSAMTNAANAVKVLNAEQRLAKAQFESTGNAEKYAAQQSDILKRKIDEQKKAVEAARQALKQLSDNGVAENSRQFQQWQTKLTNAQTALTQTETELTRLNGTMQQTTQGTQALVSSMNGISKKISLDQVISGINSITGAMETAAGKAVQLGEVIWNNIMNSAKWADDTATMALMYGIDLDTFQRMQKLVTNGLDTSVDAILNAQSKLKRGIGNGSTNVLDVLRELGLLEMQIGKYGTEEIIPEDSVQLFWDAGRALMEMTDAYDKEAAAQALFGRSWRELVPLFTDYKSLDEYNAALAEVNVNSEEDVNALAELNNKVGELKGNFETLSNEVWARMAPALTAAADALNGLLTRVLEYLETPEGKQALDDMGKAVEGLFEDLGKIDPDKVVQNFATLFEGVVGSFEWLKDNWGAVKDALFGIAIGFGALKIATLAMNIGKVVSGLGSLLGGGSGGGGGTGINLPNAQPTGGNPTGTTNGAGASWLKSMWPSVKTVASEAIQFAAGEGLVIGAAIMPALLANEYDYRESAATREERLAAVSGSESANAKIVRAAADVLLMESGKTKDFQGIEDILTGLASRQNQEKAELATILQSAKPTAGYNTWDLLNSYWNGAEMDLFMIDELLQNVTDALAADEAKKAKIKIEPVPEDDANEDIAKKIGTVTIPVKLSVTSIGGGYFGGTNGKLWESMFDMFNLTGHANGLPWVPYDGYLSVLHRGERVLTASENRSYTYNNNNYFGNVNLNNGQDIDNLCDRIDRRNRRKNSGFGE